MLHGPAYSLAQLVANGTLSQEMADVLRFGLQRGASLYVAAGPQGAGKSTLATALLECLPSNAQVYVTTGARDPLAIPTDQGPVYLLINELSWHMPLYLHGRAAQRAFGLLGFGVRMVGTVHATSVDGALRAICDEAEVAPTAICSPMLVAVVHWRRVAELGLLQPVGGQAPRVVSLATGQPLAVRGDAFAVLEDALRGVR
jgi:energy-coupling factor transporter ATP-binding protein EcfA2